MLHLGLVKRGNCWVLTLRGLIFLGASLAAILVLLVVNIHSFLAVNHPVHGEILVVEGWLPDYAIENAAREFKDHSYRLLVTTGGPLLEGSFLSQYKSYAEFAAATLRQLGFKDSLLVAVPAPAVKEDRTYESAIALKQWMHKSGLSIRSMTVYSLGPHARRSWLMFKEALGDSVTVGVIAAADMSYDPDRWWESSSGTRTVLDEAIAYLYARFFFSPKK
jgi:hypothetical protein